MPCVCKGYEIKNRNGTGAMTRGGGGGGGGGWAGGGGGGGSLLDGIFLGGNAGEGT